MTGPWGWRWLSPSNAFIVRGRADAHRGFAVHVVILGRVATEFDADRCGDGARG